MSMMPRSLLWFCDAMASKLNENAHKGDFRNETFAYLLKRLRQETKELARELTDNELLRLSSLDTRKDKTVGKDIAREAADVANFAYMIAVNANRWMSIGE